MLLYEAPGSPYAQKIKIALREKAVAFEVELPESLGTGRTDEAFGMGNPRAEVPMLVDGQTRIFDSTIIVKYIEERWPDPPLLPRPPEARAAARMTEDLCDTQYEAVTWCLSEVLWFGRATGALADTLRSAAARQTAVLQDGLPDGLAGRRGSEAPHLAGRTRRADAPSLRAERHGAAIRQRSCCLIRAAVRTAFGRCHLCGICGVRSAHAGHGRGL